MRGGKDEEKVISPMFPRLHVNDTERGGPRAPPRNKMALYEQLSIPSQRFGPGSTSMLPIPPSNGANLVPATSSSTHGGGRERSPSTPFCNSQAPSQSSMGANLNDAIIGSHEFTRPKDYQSSVAKCHSFQPPKFSNFRSSSSNKNGGERVVVASSFARSGIASHCANPQHSKDQEHPFPLFRTSSSMQAQSAEKHVNPKGLVDLNSRQSGINRTGESPKACQSLVDPSPSLSAKDLSSGSLKRAHASSDTKHRSLLDAMNKRHETDAYISQESPNLRDKTTLLEDKDKEHGSESSMVDSASVLGISPDDVVGVMGEKHFWKARRAIVNQQRVFAVQVFELHRLIKVQRMIAASTHLLLQDSLSLGKHSMKGSMIKKLSSEPVPKPRNGPQKPNPETECGGESPFPNLPLPSYGPYSGTQPVISNAKPSPPCWLVPVMSPSEGFVYKPLIAPVYGSYEPTSLTAPRNGDFLNPQPYFPPYAMPVLNPSAVDHETHLSVPRQGSCDMSSQMSRAVSCRGLKRELCKESELQGSTASSPSSRANGGEARALPLFPLASDLSAAGEEPRAKVIKVVPHNPKLATESAARIFQFIQEERKQFD